MIDRVFLQRYEPNEENERFLYGFISYLKENNKSETTLNKYEGDIKNYIEYLNNIVVCNVLEVFEEDVEDYFFYLQKNGSGKDLILRRYSCISTFYNYLIEKKWLEENPLICLSKSIYDKRRLVLDEFSLKESYIRRLRKYMGEKGSTQITLYIELSISSGVRAQSIKHIKWEQIDLKNRKIVNVMEKKNSVVTLYFSERVKELIIKLKKEREEEGTAFEYVFRKIKVGTNAKKQKDEQITFKDLRRTVKMIQKLTNVKKELNLNVFRFTCGRLLVEGGMSIEDASFILNHKTDAGSVIYENADIERIIKLKDEIGV